MEEGGKIGSLCGLVFLSPFLEHWEFFSILWGYFTHLKGEDLLLFFGYPLLFAVSVLILKLLVRVRSISEPHIRASLYAIDALLFTVAALWVYRHISDPILKLLFRDLSLSLTAIALAISVYSVSPIGRFWKLLTYLGLLGALAVEFVVIFSENLTLINLLIPLRKALILLALYPITLALVELVQLKRLKRVLRISLTGLFVLIGLLWEFNFIQFDVRAFIGLALIAVATLLFSWFLGGGMTLLEVQLKGLLSPDEEDIEELRTALRQLTFALLVYTYWLAAVYFFNLQPLVEKLKSITLIDTELVRISLYNLLVSLYLFFLLYAFIKLLKKGVKLIFNPQRREEKGASLEVVVYNLGLLLAVAVFLSELGLTWKAILPLAGALGIGLGFGLQTILNNYVSGFILMFSKNVKVGDFVEIPGSAGQFINNNSQTIFGRVEDISVLTTRIKTLDGIDILVPNSTFIGSQIINYTFKSPYVRVRFPFGVAYSSDPKKVKEILLKVAYECPWAKNYYKPPQVWFVEMGDSALIFHLLFWVDIRDIWRNVYVTVSHGLFDWVNTNAWYKLKEAGIEIPFPQRDVWFRNSLKVVLEREDGTPLAVFDAPPPPQGDKFEDNLHEERKGNSPEKD